MDKTLTKRQAQVLSGILQGRTQSQIARRLGVKRQRVQQLVVRLREMGRL